MSNCARYSPRSLPSGAGAGPEHAQARASLRSAAACCTTSAASSIAPANVRARTTVLIERHERRVAHRAAELHLALVERRIVLPARELDAVVVRIQRLDDRLARLLAAAGAAGDLREQLERPLGGAEVGQAEADVGRHDADQRHARKVVALGDHLRADEDVDLAVAEPREQRGERALAPDGVAIEPRDARAGTRARCTSASTRSVPKPACSRYGAGAQRARRRARAPCSCSSGSAPGAPCPSPCTTSDTLQFGQSSVPAHCRQNTAVAKPRRLSSTSACSPRSSARANAVAQRAAQDDVRPFGGVLLAHVDDRHGGERPIEHAALEHDALVLAGHRVVVALHRRRRRAEHDQRAGALRRGRWRRRGRCSAGSPPACTSRRAPRRR